MASIAVMALLFSHFCININPSSLIHITIADSVEVCTESAMVIWMNVLMNEPTQRHTVQHVQDYRA